LKANVPQQLCGRLGHLVIVLDKQDAERRWRRLDVVRSGTARGGMRARPRENQCNRRALAQLTFDESSSAGLVAKP
jgi:hypothetical protein